MIYMKAFANRLIFTVDNLQNEGLPDITQTPPNSLPNESNHKPPRLRSERIRPAPDRLDL